MDYSRRKYSPIKKSVIDLSELENGDIRYVSSHKRWFLHLGAEYVAMKKACCMCQKYCLIITIKDPSNEGDVYEEMLKELNKRGFSYREMNYCDD